MFFPVSKILKRDESTFFATKNILKVHLARIKFIAFIFWKSDSDLGKKISRFFGSKAATFIFINLKLRDGNAENRGER